MRKKIFTTKDKSYLVDKTSFQKSCDGKRLDLGQRKKSWYEFNVK